MMSAAGPLTHADAKALRKAALAYPDTVEDFPWGERAFKAAGKKVFMFLWEGDARISLSLKLPFRHEEALTMKGAERTGYGLGRAGWVTFTYAKTAKLPLAKLSDYLDESWRAAAPRKLSAQFAPPPPKRRKGS